MEFLKLWPMIAFMLGMLIAGLIWFIRLESTVRNNKTEQSGRIDLVKADLENHKETSKEKHDTLFKKLGQVQTDVGEIKTSVAVIADHIKKG